MVDGPPLIGPLGFPFGFLAGGHYNLTVDSFRMHGVKGESVDKVEGGFFLKRYENEAQFNEIFAVLSGDATLCSYVHFQDSFDDIIPEDDQYEPTGIPSAKEGLLLAIKQSKYDTGKATTSIEYTFKADEAGLYFLIYQVCPSSPNIRSSFDLEFHFVNYDSLGNPSYLTAGEMRLPLLFFFFSLSYLICFIIWVMNNREIGRGHSGLFSSNGQPIVYPIHHLMSALLLTKFLATFLESIRYHYIRVMGHAELWSMVYYVFTFIRGTFLFTVILLIGTGWSFVKPFLSPREKQVVAFILVLQVGNNIALIVLSQITEGESRFDRWTASLHLIDILCCCAVLLPIVWQVNTLEKSIGEEVEDMTDEEREQQLESSEKGQILRKLRLFRSFYLLVVAYIYSTRILVYLFSTMLDYRHLWVQHFVVELVTLAFYVTVGCMFRPMTENPYLSVGQRETTSSSDVELSDRNSSGKGD